MDSQNKGCISLFRVGGITVLLHWSWFLVAIYQIGFRRDKNYPSLAWNVAEYLTLFLIVLLHEFGHAFACRMTGGKAERIVLWPLGGVAYVDPPARPGALLWSIAAGPLVNLALVPITIGLTILVHLSGVGALPHVDRFCFVVVVMNLILLVFNLLPVYPLDGGQILQALLWFLMGRANSLLVSGILGLVGAGGLFLLASLMQSSWGMILAVFVGFQALAGVRQAFVLFRIQPGLDHLNRALDLVRQGEGEKALDECDRALELLPQGHRACAEAHACRALALAALDDHAGAVAGYSEALRRIPDSASYYLNRGVSHSRQGHYDLALEDYGMALKLAPQSPMALNNLAWLWATCPDPHFRDGARAVEYARRACTLRGREMPTFLSTLAAAYAEVGNFAEAIACLEKALENPRYDREHGVQARQRIQLYEAEQPFREEPTTRANHKPAL